MKQKGDDYKISAVKYYLNNNDTMENTCKIFNCKNHHYIDGYKYTKLKRIYKENQEYLFLIKLKKNKLKLR